MVFRVVGEEGRARVGIPGPHGRPEKVGPEAEEELKDFFVEFDVVTSKLFPDPAGKGWCLIIDENATISDAGLAADGSDGQRVDFGVLLGRDISPPIPAIRVVTILVQIKLT